MNAATRDYLRAGTILAALVLMAFAAVATPMPWSPMGQAQQSSKTAERVPTFDLSEFDIPDGWVPGNGTRIVMPRDPATLT